MDAFSVMLSIVDGSGKSRVSVSREIGRSDNYLSAHVIKPSIPRADTLAKVIGVCGYDLIARNRETGHEIVIDSSRPKRKTE